MTLPHSPVTLYVQSPEARERADATDLRDLVLAQPQLL